MGILSSDLPRARQTAEHLAQATGLPVHTSALLQERNFGELRGLAYDSLSIDPMTMDEAPPGGESQASFEHRVAQAFAHALALQAAWAAPWQWSPTAWWSRPCSATMPHPWPARALRSA